MKTLQFFTCSIFVLSTTLLQPAQAQEQLRTSPVVASEVVTTNSNAAFAVTMIRYEARYTPVMNRVFIDWQTISEPNNARFEIERDNGQGFSKIGSIQSNQNGSGIKYYRFTDTAPVAGRNFYRLKQISTDSSFTYSRSVSVTTRLGNNLIALTLSPNPCEGGNCDVRITNPTPNQPILLELIDQNSRVIFSRTLTENSTLTNLTAQEVAGLKGMYFLRLQAGSETTVQRVFLK